MGQCITTNNRLKKAHAVQAFEPPPTNPEISPAAPIDDPLATTLKKRQMIEQERIKQRARERELEAMEILKEQNQRLAEEEKEGKSGVVQRRSMRAAGLSSDFLLPNAVHVSDSHEQEQLSPSADNLTFPPPPNLGETETAHAMVLHPLVTNLILNPSASQFPQLTIALPVQGPFDRPPNSPVIPITQALLSSTNSLDARPFAYGHAHLLQPISVVVPPSSAVSLRALHPRRHGRSRSIPGSLHHIPSAPLILRSRSQPALLVSNTHLHQNQEPIFPSQQASLSSPESVPLTALDSMQRARPSCNLDLPARKKASAAPRHSESHYSSNSRRPIGSTSPISFVPSQSISLSFLSPSKPLPPLPSAPHLRPFSHALPPRPLHPSTVAMMSSISASSADAEGHLAVPSRGARTNSAPPQTHAQEHFTTNTSVSFSSWNLDSSDDESSVTRLESSNGATRSETPTINPNMKANRRASGHLRVVMEGREVDEAPLTPEMRYRLERKRERSHWHDRLFSTAPSRPDRPQASAAQMLSIGRR